METNSTEPTTDQQELNFNEHHFAMEEKEKAVHLMINSETCDSDVNTKDLKSSDDQKHKDSDVNTKDLKSSDDQNGSGSGDISQFYEGSNSKEDYALKIDDNDTLSDIDDIKTDTASAASEDSALGSLPPEHTLNEKEEDGQDRSDGSDSGLGSETVEDIKLPNFTIALPSSSSSNNKVLEKLSTENADGIDDNHKQDRKELNKPLKSSLKRKCSEKDVITEPLLKKRKEAIQFDNVTVFYFTRAQGFSCVPSQGGSTLGMEWEHCHIQKFTLAEHAVEQRRLHRQLLQQLKSERHSVSGVSLSSSEDSDTEEETSDISESELDLDSYYFLQPVPTRQRRALLRAAGVRKIEGYEKDECRDIRTSREFCGCACKGVCNPDSCSCSMAGIKCQVDRLHFPCGCSREGCGNTSGRIEFNPIRVRTHFINTLMRLGLEKKNAESQEVNRQWASVHAISSTPPCIPKTTFEKDHCQNIQNSALHSRNSILTSQVESCVSSIAFANAHSDINKAGTSSSITEENTNQKNGKEIRILNFEDKSTHRNHDPYTSNILQGKGPPFSVPNAIEFNMANNLQRYSCDLNYTYEQHHNGNHVFKSLQSYSASSFEEFAQNSHISMFNPYGHVYTTEYMHKPSTSTAEHNSLQYHGLAQHHYDMYKNNSACVNSENKSDSNYTALMTMPYQSSNKLQSVDNDENWFSQNTLLNLDNSEQTTQDASDASQPTQTSSEGDANEVSENFGELIKKTMVESVIV